MPFPSAPEQQRQRLGGSLLLGVTTRAAFTPHRRIQPGNPAFNYEILGVGLAGNFKYIIDWRRKRLFLKIFLELGFWILGDDIGIETGKQLVIQIPYDRGGLRQGGGLENGAQQRLPPTGQGRRPRPPRAPHDPPAPARARARPGSPSAPGRRAGASARLRRDRDNGRTARRRRG